MGGTVGIIGGTEQVTEGVGGAGGAKNKKAAVVPIVKEKSFKAGTVVSGIPDLSKSLTQVQTERMWKWIDALKSGKYKQTHAALRFDDGFCCLGVACDLAGPEIGKKWIIGSAGGSGRLFTFAASGERTYPSSYNYLPKDVAEYFGLLGSLGFDVIVTGRENSLAWYNDNGMSFLQIAKVLEAAVTGRSTVTL
jgi:hypothetical protein